MNLHRSGWLQLSLRRLVGSTTVCLVLLLLALEVSLRLGHDQHMVDVSPLMQNIHDTIVDKKINPDILIVGSSLSQCFTYNVEHPSNTPDPPVIEHTSNCSPDRFMSAQIEELIGKPAQVQVISLPGAMIGEICQIVEYTYANAKKPRTVVYLAAPRDFIDRLNAPQKQSLRLAVLSPEKATSPKLEERIQRWISTRLPSTVVSRLDTLDNNPSPVLAFELVLDCCSQVYEQRAQLRSSLLDWVCSLLNRDPDLWSAVHQYRATNGKMTHFDHDLANYNMRYNPPDFQRLKAEARTLSRLASVCASNSSRFVLVNMPLTSENKQLLDARLHDDYKHMLADLAKSESALVIDSDQGKFDRPDFLDSAHLNAAGSRKLQLLLAPQLAGTLSEGDRQHN